MSDHDTTNAHPANAHGNGHGDGHGDGDGHGEHGHGADTLGPIDWRMWGVGIVGVVAALIVVAGFVVATDFAFFTVAN